MPIRPSAGRFQRLSPAPRRSSAAALGELCCRSTLGGPQPPDKREPGRCDPPRTRCRPAADSADQDGEPDPDLTDPDGNQRDDADDWDDFEPDPQLDPPWPDWDAFDDEPPEPEEGDFWPDQPEEDDY